MEKLGTYRGYNIAIERHCSPGPDGSKWHCSVRISPIGQVTTEPPFATQPPDDNAGAARTRAIRIAKSIIDKRPGVGPISPTDLPDE